MGYGYIFDQIRVPIRTQRRTIQIGVPIRTQSWTIQIGVPIRTQSVFKFGVLSQFPTAIS